MIVCAEAIALIKHFEGFRAVPYQCSARVWTVGYGSTYTPDGTPVAAETPMLGKAEAEQWLQGSLRVYAREVYRLIKVPLNSNQHGALVSFAYNVGMGSLQSSTLRAKLNRGDYHGAAQEFPKWRRAGGMILLGLVKRRAAEQHLFNKENDHEQ